VLNCCKITYNSITDSSTTFLRLRIGQTMDPNRPFGARILGDNYLLQRPRFRGVGRRLAEDDAPPNAAGPDPAQNGVLARHRVVIARNVARRGRAGQNNIARPVRNQQAIPFRRQPQIARRGRRLNQPAAVPPVIANQAMPIQFPLNMINRVPGVPQQRQQHPSRPIVNVDRAGPAKKRVALTDPPDQDVGVSKSKSNMQVCRLEI
jgi:hypothetical protein